MSEKAMSQVIAIDKILEYLPHRYPFVMVDRVVDYKTNEYIEGIKNVSINEPYFMGHFPGKPVMPGVLIVESLAQVGGILTYLSSDDVVAQQIHYFAGINNVRFKQVIRPGDQLHLKVTIKARKRNIWMMHGEAFVEGNLACSADLTSAMQDIVL